MNISSSVISIVSPEAVIDKKAIMLLTRKLAAYHPPRRLRDSVKVSCTQWDPQSPGDWLLVICTPDAREDKAVLEAVDFFLKAGLRNRVLLALAKGEPADSFPYSLRFERDENGLEIEREPLAADIRGRSLHSVRKKLRTEPLRLLAPIYGVGYDDLRQRQKEHALRLALFFSTTVMLFAVGFMVFALDRANVINKQNVELDQKYSETLKSEQESLNNRNRSVEARSRTLSVQSQEELSWGDTQMALLLALEALPKRNDDSPVTDEAQAALHNALAAYGPRGYVSTTAWTPYSGQPAIFVEALDNLEKMRKDESKSTLPEYLNIDGFSYTKRFSHPDAKVAVYYCYRTDDKGAPYCVIYTSGDSAPYRPLIAPDGSYATVLTAALSAEGTLYAYYNKGIYRWDLYSGTCEGPFDIGPDIGELSCMFYTDSGKWVFIGERYGRAWLVDAASGEPVSFITDDIYTSRSYDRVDLDILDDGTSPVLVFSNSKRAAVCDLLSGELICELEYDGNFITKPKVSADGRYVAALCGESVRIYDAQSGSVLHRFPADKDSIVEFTGAYEFTVKHCGGEALIIERTDDNQNVCKFLLVYQDSEVNIPELLPDRINLAKALLGGRTFTTMEKDKFYIQ